MIRIATAGYQHESNTFSAIPASLDLWRRSGILEDAAVDPRRIRQLAVHAGRLLRRAEAQDADVSWCRCSSRA
jgi:microcystin degradation protein MlrC